MGRSPRREGHTRAATAVLATSIGLVAATPACGGRGPELRHPVGETTSSGAPLVRSSSDTPDGSGDRDDVRVVVTWPVRAACGMPNTASSAPRFGFDSAKLMPRGEDILEAVARCVAIGPLVGESIVVVGHTDPQGSAEYNEKLGLYRAQAAKNHLIELGLSGSAILVESRGQREARGVDEAGWELDRRVEVHLARDVSAAPGAETPPSDRQAAPEGEPPPAGTAPASEGTSPPP
jgi:outer membrane protein OmpA-like peptidoglycan-associated protein